jgi:hypothetical protein
MTQTTQENQSIPFTTAFKSTLAYEALSSNNISDTSRNNKTSRKTVYKYRNEAKVAIEQHFEEKDESTLYNMPISKSSIDTAIVTLSGVCKASERDIQTAIHYLYDYPVSTGHISGVLNQISKIAGNVNDTYTFEDCKSSTSDECYHRGDPILAVADIPSKFCLLLEREDKLDQDTWEMYLDELKSRKFYPTVNLLDGGTSMNPAFKTVFEKTKLRYDHFHIIKTIKELLRFLKNKKESAVTLALKCFEKLSKKDTPDNQTQWDVASMDMNNYEDIYFNTSTLLTWMQYDILQLSASNPSIRSELFDFIIEELSKVAVKHHHRITDIITTLSNQKDSLLDVAESLNTQFKDIAIKHSVSLDTVWEICYFSRYKLNSQEYQLQSLALDAELGDTFDLIEDKVLNFMDTTYRTSSVIENFNSRLRPYIDARKGFKSNRYSFIQFMLNHLPFKRSANPDHKGKSAAEIFTGKGLPEWTELLNLTRFKRVA